MIRTNVEIDEKKLKMARKITGLTTAKAIVDFALGRLTESSEALSELVRLSGKIHFRQGYSHKKAR